MPQYVIFLRGINVGGKNKISMAELRAGLEKLGLTDVRSYIASGNVIASSSKSAKAVQEQIEKDLPRRFKLDAKLVKVLALTPAKLRAVVENRPKGFGDNPGKYHSDVVFLIDITPTSAMKVFSPREGIDTIWPGKGVIYSQRLSEQRTKSRLNKIVGTSEYQCMTIRTWNTVTKLLAMIDE
jgi:uncharacterized protein (DUF1697 family)